MMTDADFLRAIHLLDTGGICCALCENSVTITGSESSIETLLKLLRSKVNTKGFFVADRIVGKSSAFLYALLGVKAVYADIMSEPAIYTLARYGIYPCCKQAVLSIEKELNPTICEMDQAVSRIRDAHLAVAVMENKYSAAIPLYTE